MPLPLISLNIEIIRSFAYFSHRERAYIIRLYRLELEESEEVIIVEKFYCHSRKPHERKEKT